MSLTPSLPHAVRRLRLAGVLLLSTFAVAVHAATSYVAITAETSSATTQIPNAYQPGAALTLAVIDRPYPSASVQWLHDDQPIAGATTFSFTLPQLSTADTGNYRLRVTSGTDVTYSNTVVVNVLPATVSPVDPSFSAQLPSGLAPSNVTAFAEDGSFIVQLNSGATTLRLNADGHQAAGFNYPASAGTVLAGFADGRLITSHAPYVLNADGSLSAFTLPAPFDSTQPLSGAAITSDGKFYLSQGRMIVRFLANGSVDPSFTFTPFNDHDVTAYAVDRQGRLFVNARRFDPNPHNYPSSWTIIYRLDLAGARDTAFPEQTSILMYSSSRLKVVPLADGRIFSWSAYHGYYLWRIYREDGSFDQHWSGGVFSDYDLTVDPARARVYVRLSGGVLHRFRLTATSLEEDADFFPGLTPGWTFPSFTIAPDGKLILLTNSAAWEGHATQSLARLRTDLTRPTLPPSVDVNASTTSPARGDTLTLSTQVDAAGPFTYQWLALDGQPLPTTTSSSLVIPDFSAAHFGRYQLRVNGTFGSLLSSVIELHLSTANLPYLANLSGRAVPGSGEDTTLAGFTTKVYAGALGVPLLLRGVGPGLKDLGVANFASNPALNLFNRSATVVANNDNWSATPDRDAIRTLSATTGAFALAEGSLDAALLKTSYNEQFSAQLVDQTGTAGVGLLEIYQTPAPLASAGLINLSLRARTGPGEATAIAGFVIVDPQNFDRPAKVLLRAVGPTLSTQGIVHPLADPVLTVYNAQGEIVAQNDNWPWHLTAHVTEFDAATFQVGAFSLLPDSKDAALLLDLPAGAYSMHATGGSGVVLLEIYLVR